MRATTQQLEAFTAIVERQGITAAADQLGWSKSKVSKVISELEAQIGVTLFYRSTRGLRVTSEGLSFYQDVVEYLSAMDASIDRLTESAPNASGHIKVAAPLVFQQHVLTPALKALSAENIRLDVSLSDERPDLNRRDHDLYIHIGHLQDGDYYAQRICQTELMYVASPAFLARHPAGISPRDLRHVDVLRYSHHGVMVPWHLDGEPIAVNPEAKLVSNTGEYLAEAAIDGLGVTQLTDFMARPFIDSGRLVQMFPDHRPYWMPVYLLYFERTKQSRALKRSLAIVGQYLKDFCEAAARVEAPQRREKSTPALG